MCKNEEITILRKHFNIWKTYATGKKDKIEAIHVKLEQREKLNTLLKLLRKRKSKRSVLEENNKEVEHFKTRNQTENYKHRYEAQISTVEQLTVKLEEKDRIIENLKLGILESDALKSLEDSKNQIREIFGKCSTKVRCKTAPPPDYGEQFMVSTQKAPKILQQLEEKAMERARNHEIILERKKIIEEKRKRMMKEALDKKRIQDEEEKAKTLEALKERRRVELEKSKIREANKAKFLAKFNMSVEFHEQILLKRGFGNFLRNWRENKMKEVISEVAYKKNILTKTMRAWKNRIEEKYEAKYKIADELFAWSILQKTFKAWIIFRTECVRSMQVAEDFYDFKLQSSFFVHWHRYVCIQFVRRDKLLKWASECYRRKIVVHYFYQWRSLPAVMKLEKAKEEKKKKWREKVNEILLDYKPPAD